jgi:hypothetical protein
MLNKWKKSKKGDLIGLRISREFKEFLKEKADKLGVSLSELIENNLYDTYKSDEDIIKRLIKRRKSERPAYWEELDKSPITREFEEHIATLFTKFVNPIAKRDYKYQPVVLIGLIDHLLSETIKHFNSIPEEHKRMAAYSFLKIGKTLTEALPLLRANDKETEKEIIIIKKEIAEKLIYHLSALVFAKDSYNKIKAELDKIQAELIKGLDKK